MARYARVCGKGFRVLELSLGFKKHLPETRDLSDRISEPWA